MTQSNELETAITDTTYYQPNDPAVRGMPFGSRGARGGLAARDMLDLAALASAAGTTRAQIRGMVDDWQEATMAAVVAATPKMIERNRQITQARVNEIWTKVERLGRIRLASTAPATGWRGLIGVQQPIAQEDLPEYVSVDQLRVIFHEAIAALNSPE